MAQCPGLVVTAPGGGGGPSTAPVVVRVPFTFATSSPLDLGPLRVGNAVSRAALIITTPFDDGAATLALGTTMSPGMFLATTDSKPSVAGQYETDLITGIATVDDVALTIAAGASTQGAGFVYLEKDA